jgi:hypothetical protein
MIGPAMDELLASLQYLKREHHAGRSLWHAFWGSGDVADDARAKAQAAQAGGK